MMRILRGLRLTGVVLLLAQSALCVAQGVASIALENGVFKVKGWKAPAAAPAQGWGSLFVVYAGAGDVPPLLGSYLVEGGTLEFRPQFPFAAGVHYRAVFRQEGGAVVEKTFDGPSRETVKVARVEHVYPSGDVLPSNLLRVYFYFSSPMSRDEAGRRVHLLDESGKELKDVFLPGEELWDPGYKRLTLTLDPGRIKRGLTSNQKMGPPIVPGKQYALVVDSGWLDARGVPMVEGFRKVFRGGLSVRVPPDPKEWKITAPKAGSVDPLVVDFPHAMNYPLLMRMLKVNGVAGTVKVERGEMEWRFKPSKPWTAGGYQLEVNTAIEDVAGNRVGLPFDVDVFDKVTEHIETKTMSLGFVVR
jgi:hypothetical protein